MSIMRSSKAVAITGLILLMLIVSLVYSNHFRNSFHFDDNHTIVNNLAIRNLHNWPSFFKDGTTFSSLPSNQSYRPVVTMLNAIDYHLGGKTEPDPFIFHVSIFASYLALGLLFFLFVLNILKITVESKLNIWVALFTTGWFWLHAANAETINYIIARSDSFSTMLVVMAFAWYIYIPAHRKYYLYMIPVIVGFFTKEPAILFVPLLFLYKLFFEADLSVKDFFRKMSKSLEVLKHIAVPIVIAIIIFIVYKSKTPTTWTPGGKERLPYILTQPYVIFHYFMNFLLPVDLVVDTDRQPVAFYTHPWVFSGIFFLLTLSAIALVCSAKKQYRPVTFGIFWFLITLAPTSLIPFAEVLNDHRTFLPYIGLFIAFASVIRNLLASIRNFDNSVFTKTIVIVAGSLILALHAYGTVGRNRIWRDEGTLWKEATVKAPGNGRAWMNYGLSLMSKGDYTGAEECFLKTLSIWPNYSYIHINMGVLKAAKGDSAAADKYFRRALELGPGNPGSYSFYIDFLMKNGRYAEANKLVKKGLTLSPSHPVLNRQAVRLEQNEIPDNEKPPAVSGTLTAGYYLNLSLAHYNAGHYEECIDAAYKALELKPDYDLAYNNICAAYNQLQQWDKAVEAGEKGLKIHPDNNLLKGNLQVSYRRGR